MTTTHRIHISGLTPAFTASDLTSCLSSFGTVTSLDHFGELNGVGQPSSFAFINVEASSEQLKKCMNLLSGTTWKGTTLKLSLAKPDWQQRREQESQTTSDQCVKKKRKRIEAEHSDDMSLMTKEKFSKQITSGWKKDPSTHLPIFPTVMRPSHPILQPRKVNNNAPPSVPHRARRIRIDPTQERKRHIVGARDMTTELYRLGQAGGVGEAKKRRGLVWKCEDADNGDVVWSLVGSDASEPVVQDRVTPGRLGRLLASAVHEDRTPIECAKIVECVSTEQRHDGLDQQLLIERRRQREVIASLGLYSDGVLDDVGEGLRAAVQRQKAREVDVGRAWVDSATEIEVVPLRLRGGGASEKSRRRRGLEHDKVITSTLGSMFRGKAEASAFHLLADDMQGVELDDAALGNDDVDAGATDTKLDTSMHPARQAAMLRAPAEDRAVTTTVQQRLRANAAPTDNELFFAFPTVEERDADGLLADTSAAEVDRLRALCPFHRVAARVEGDGARRWRTFGRYSTTTRDETIDEDFRAAWTDRIRRRHRDAVRAQRKGRRLR